MSSIKTLLKSTVFLAVLLIILNFVPKSCSYTGAENGPNTKFKDMPNVKDLNSYLYSIKKIVKFSNSIKNVLKKDINLAFGLFLMNVAKMISNDTAWAMRTIPFTRTTPINLRRGKEKSFKVWDENKESFRFAGPVESDSCLMSLLANNDTNATEETPVTPPLCKIPYHCYNIIRDGGGAGFAMSHRFLFMLMARHGRYCTVFSVEQDKKVSARMCDSMYAEAENMAAHGFQLLDLFVEQVALCSVDGHIDFLQRSWLAKILEHQQDEGCFKTSTDFERLLELENTTSMVQWPTLMIWDQLLGGKCNRHMTACAAGALGAGVRLIITLTDFLVVE